MGSVQCGHRGKCRLAAVDPWPRPVIRQLREQVSDNDRALIEAINVRLRLVEKLKDYKDSRGIDFVDPDREEWMLRRHGPSESGPALAAGARGSTAILALTKREVS